MDKLTAASCYSKGTICTITFAAKKMVSSFVYSFFKRPRHWCLLVLESLKATREKIVALHVAYRIYARMEPVLSTCAIMAKKPVGAKRLVRVAEMNELEELVIEQCDSMVNQAVEAGDLSSLLRGFQTSWCKNWSIAFGSNALSQNASNSHCIQTVTRSVFSIT